jgi:DMSO/TMAO reductase YedYZ heme-binding membrane subunit
MEGDMPASLVGRIARRWEGPPAATPYLIALALLALAAGYSLTAHDSTEDVLGSLTRLTARIAFCFFFVVFTASAWRTWKATPLTTWLLRRRRHLGLSFALVHFVHLGALTSLFVTLGEMPARITVIGGGLAYLLLLALVLTSNQAAQRRLGRRWRILHLTGCWYLWFVFTQSYLGRLVPSAGAEPYGQFVVLSLLALAIPVLRNWAWSSRRNRRREPHATAL